MEREELARMIEAGWSYERIACEAGVNPSTVARAARRHGLQSSHRDRHAPRGGVSRDRLEALVTEGLSIRAIARQLDLGTATVRHWLRKYGLQTAATRNRSSAWASEPRPHYARRECRTHGPTRFVLEGRGYYRCTRCRMEQVSERRRRVKRILVAEAGGACAICGYSRHPAALQFHHLDPASKAFNLALRGETRRIDELRAEARKCVLLCANCHAEVEAGVARVPSEAVPAAA